MEAQIHQLEQEAYTAVLRAFKAQSDAISWEKESLITELRKELRVSDEEHRELLTSVNKDDTIQNIRDWRKGGESHATIQRYDVLPSPSSRKKQKTFPSYNPSIGATGSFNNRVVVSGGNGSLIGRKVWTKWPEDNNFYQAVITQYNAEEDRHVLVYDIYEANETWEWVDLKEIPPEDIRWDGEDSRVALNIGNGRSQLHGDRRRGPRIHEPRRQLVPTLIQHNGDGGGFELFNTDSLVKEVEKVFENAHPNPHELYKAKKMLKEHEEALMAAIARLTNISDGEIDVDASYPHEHPMLEG